jgi:hypothetical protein
VVRTGVLGRLSGGCEETFGDTHAGVQEGNFGESRLQTFFKRVKGNRKEKEDRIGESQPF